MAKNGLQVAMLSSGIINVDLIIAAGVFAVIVVFIESHFARQRKLVPIAHTRQCGAGIRRRLEHDAQCCGGLRRNRVPGGCGDLCDRVPGQQVSVAHGDRGAQGNQVE